MSNRAELRLLLGGVVIGVALSSASWWGVSRYLRGLLEQSEGRHHGKWLAAKVQEMGGGERFFADVRAAATPSTRAELARAVMVHGVLRVKIYDIDGTILWSDAEELIGKRFPDNFLLEEALHGGIVTKIERPVRKEHVYERGMAPEVLEAYVPMRGDGGGVVGVVEVYVDAGELLSEVRSSARAVLGGVVFLCATLLCIFASLLRKGVRYRTEAESERHTRIAQLSQANRISEIGMLLGSISHQVNQPVGIISGKVQNLLAEFGKDRIPARVHDELEKVSKQLDRLAELTSRLLRHVRASTGGPIPSDVNAALIDSLDLLSSRFLTGSVEVKSDFARDLPRVRISSMEMQQVFLNLLNNAVDAIGKGGELRLKTEAISAPSRTVSVLLRDNGSGMSTEVLARVFDPFFTTKGAAGTGLGLPICKEILTRHGGTIVVESMPAKGTTVRVSLPCDAS